MNITISSTKIEQFQDKIFRWYEKNKRSFPWRETTDPYYIMISEFMLQQTQTSRVVPKYNSFIDQFPTLRTLAYADFSEVLKLWSGLGYNRRALYLHQAAKKLVELGYFPDEPKELEKIKGIGKYTSRSIVIFAFNKDIATVDTNIRRVFIYENFAFENTSDKELFAIAKSLLPSGRSRDWHNALMDYGALVVNAQKTGIKPKSKQNKYQRSNRQYRGILIKYLTEKGSVSIEEIRKRKIIPEEKIEFILSSLEKDKLIIKNGRNYVIS